MKAALAGLVLSALLASAPTAGAAEPLRGLFVFGHEVRTLQPCGGEAVFWIRASGKVLAQLREEHGSSPPRPYQQLYIVAWGAVRDAPADGFALDYDGQIAIEDIVVVRERHDVHCRPTARPDELVIADLGVVCNRRQDVCYDHAGANIGLTQLFRGDAAADRLLAELRRADSTTQDRSRFEVADGIECRAETRSCLVDGSVDPLLGEALFAHAMPRRTLP